MVLPPFHKTPHIIFFLFVPLYSSLLIDSRSQPISDYIQLLLNQLGWLDTRNERSSWLKCTSLYELFYGMEGVEYCVPR